MTRAQTGLASGSTHTLASASYAHRPVMLKTQMSCEPLFARRQSTAFSATRGASRAEISPHSALVSGKPSPSKLSHVGPGAVSVAQLRGKPRRFSHGSHECPATAAPAYGSDASSPPSCVLVDIGGTACRSVFA